MLPVVMGATIENYKKLLPPSSFIHVDNFKGPAALAEHLKILEMDDEAYR